MLDTYDLSRIVRPLQDWFVENARRLPWRAEVGHLANPYYVWISEIMLQQTRVEAVKPYFVRFIGRLPDVASLAECPQEELFKLWEGLGYYNRARNLKTAAVQIMEHWGGELPVDYEALKGLKGIGPYTAGAIASIAFGQAVPAVDGNVLRVISRITADEGDIAKQSVKKHMEKVLGEMMGRLQAPLSKVDAEGFMQSGNLLWDSKEEQSAGFVKALRDPADQRFGKAMDPGLFNQALMELGAVVCVPNGDPLCEKCPLKSCCLARQEGRERELPVKLKAVKRRIEERTVFVLRSGKRVAVRKRPEGGLLGGLYELPNQLGYLEPEEIQRELASVFPQLPEVRKLPTAKHIFSHVEWRMQGYEVWIEESGEKNRSKSPMETGEEDRSKSPMEVEEEDRSKSPMEVGEEGWSKSPMEVGEEDQPKSPMEVREEGWNKRTFKGRNKTDPKGFHRVATEVQTNGMEQGEFLFVDVDELREKYAMPAAFGAYMDYLYSR